MPSRAYTSFLRDTALTASELAIPVSMPSRAYTSFLLPFGPSAGWKGLLCQCPLGLIPHFYQAIRGMHNLTIVMCVNALSGLYLISTRKYQQSKRVVPFVSMPSRAYTSFLRSYDYAQFTKYREVCQCPLGLIPHFY